MYAALCKSEKRQGELYGELKWLRVFANKNLGLALPHMSDSATPGTSDGRGTPSQSGEGSSSAEPTALASQFADRVTGRM